VSRLPVCSGADAVKAFAAVGYTLDHLSGRCEVTLFAREVNPLGADFFFGCSRIAARSVRAAHRAAATGPCVVAGIDDPGKHMSDAAVAGISAVAGSLTPVLV